MSKKVLVFGTFDVLHPGHLYFLHAAKQRGNHLTVVVARDSSAKASGKRPVFNERERKIILEHLRDVNEVVLGDREERWSVISRVKPDVICVGYNQRMNHPALAEQLPALKKKPRLVRLRGVNIKRWASRLIKKCW